MGYGLLKSLVGATCSTNESRQLVQSTSSVNKFRQLVLSTGPANWSRHLDLLNCPRISGKQKKLIILDFQQLVSQCWSGEIHRL